MENFKPIIQRKTITMDYEEYLKLEKRANLFTDVVVEIINAKTLDDLKSKYLKILDEINKEILNGKLV